MSNKYSSLLVVLEHDVSEEQARALSDAIRQMRGVVSATPNASDFTALVAEERVRLELGKKLLKVLYPNMYGDKPEGG